jgi:hypothetical protein
MFVIEINHPLQILIKVRFLDSRGHKKKPSTKVLGFLFLGASKIYFDLRIKQKDRELRQQFGFYAWIEPKIGKTRERNPSGVTTKAKAPFLHGLGLFF